MRATVPIDGSLLVPGRVQTTTPALSSERSNASAHPRLASGLAGLGCGATLTATASSPSAARARSAANRPTPSTCRVPSTRTTCASAASHALVERRAFGGGELVGGAVSPRIFHEAERAVVPDEETFEEAPGLAEPAPGPAPEPASAHLSARTVEAGDGPLRMLDARSRDLSFYAQPVTGDLDIAERYAGLRHPERTGIHPEHQNLGRPRAVAQEIRPVRCPCVLERVVDVGHRGGEGECAGPA